MCEYIKNSQRFTTSAESKPIYSKDYSLESVRSVAAWTAAIMCSAKVRKKSRLSKGFRDKNS